MIRIAKRDFLAAISIILSMYFMFSPFEDILVTNIGTISKGLAVLTVFFILLFMLSFNQKVNIASKHFVFSMLFLIITWISILFSKYVTQSISMAITYSSLIGLYLFISFVPFSSNNIKMLKKAIELSGIFVFFYMILSGGIDFSRFSLSSNNDPNNLAAFMLAPIFVSLNNIFEEKKNSLSIISFILSMVILLLTGSRGAFLSLILGFVTWLFLNIKKIRQIVFFIPVVILIVVILGSLESVQNIIYRVINIESYIYDITLYGSRIHIWTIVLNDLIPNMSIWGYGVGNSSFELIPYFGYAYGIHNTYLNSLIEFGVIGFIVFLAFIGNILKDSFKFSKNSLLIGLLVSIFVVIFFLDSLPKKYFWNVLFIMLIINNKERNLRNENPDY